ncbi:MAG: hypothetical protein ABSC65_26730 [Acidobacteriaceae bacterium]
MKSAAGDSVVLQAPGGTEYLTVLASAKELPRRRSPDEKATTVTERYLLLASSHCLRSGFSGELVRLCGRPLWPRK